MTTTRSPRLLLPLSLLALLAAAPAASALAPAPPLRAGPAGELDCVEDPAALLPCETLQKVLDELGGGLPTYYVRIAWAFGSQLSCIYEPLVDLTVIVDEVTLTVEVGQDRGGVQYPIVTVNVPYRAVSVYAGNAC
ncbi:MAG TPA: hypothetical protein VNX21_08055 [Candidatus Thermoplasmatota archaeon]|nr:hypothetical protein [Candidatus Thermoplasmatota archaeon]